MMLALHCPIPANLDAFTGVDNSFCMIVGAEDANLSGSDWDMNDVVFLIVGYPNIPDVVEHYFKRYLLQMKRADPKGGTRPLGVLSACGAGCISA